MTDLNERQFEATLDDDLRQLDHTLRTALRAPQASEQLISACELAVQLKQSLDRAAPPDMVDRIVTHTTPQPRSVLARIGPAWHTAAAIAAAVIVIAILSFSISEAPLEPETINVASLLDEIDQLAADADLAGSALLPIDGDLAAISLELEQFAWGLAYDPFDNPLESQIDQLTDDLLLMEAELDVF